MKIEKLSGVGAEITGVDLRHLTSGEFAVIRQAYADNGVIFFRDQTLSEKDHIAFAERWAPININRFFAAHPGYPQIAVVAKEKDQKDNIGGGWHTDHSYDSEPAMGSILVARVLPDTGGDTMFASMYRAYDTLDDATQAWRELELQPRMRLMDFKVAKMISSPPPVPKAGIRMFAPLSEVIVTPATVAEMS